MIFLKGSLCPASHEVGVIGDVLPVQFALSVLSILNAMYSLGALGGALSVLVWGALNICEHIITNI